MSGPLIDYFDRTPLFFPAYTGDIEAVKALLERAEISAVVNLGPNTQGDHSPIFISAYGGGGSKAAETVGVLLKHGANSRKRDNVGRVPLHIAANSQDPAVIKRLLAVPDTDIHLFVNHKADDGRTPFHALFLPGCGANGDAKPSNADLPQSLNLLLAASNRPLESLTEKDNYGFSPAMLAKHYGLSAVFNTIDPTLKAQLKLDEIQLPAKSTEVLEKYEFFGRTSLIAAAFQSSDNNVATKANKELIRKYVAANSPELIVPNKQSDRCPLALACSGLSDGETVDILLSSKIVNPIQPDSHGRTPAHFACNTGRIDTTRALLRDPRVVNPAIDGDINRHVDDQGRTLLDAAAMAGSRLATREQVIDLLFEKGISTENARKALALANSRGNKAVEARIEQNLALRVKAEQAGAAQAVLASASSQPGLIIGGSASGPNLAALVGTATEVVDAVPKVGAPKLPGPNT